MLREWIEGAESRNSAGCLGHYDVYRFVPDAEVRLANTRLARAVIEAVGRYAFLSVIHCADGSYMELLSESPRRAAERAHEVCTAAGYTLTHIEIPRDVANLQLGAELDHLIEHQEECRKIQKRIREIRRKHRRKRGRTDWEQPA